MGVRTRRLIGCIYKAFEMPVDQIVSFGRVAMVAFASVAIYLGPTQPTRLSNTADALLVTYLVFALFVYVATRQRDLTKIVRTTVQAIDILIFSILIFLTEGSTSPFFVFFTFTLLSAMLQWGSRGTVAIALLLSILMIMVSAVYASLAPFGWEEFELNRLIIRSTYLLVAGGMLACVAKIRERMVQRLEALATWPMEDRNGGASDERFLEATLRHAAGILKARRVLVLWQDMEEPDVEAYYWDGANQSSVSFGQQELADLVSCGGRHDVFTLRDAHQHTEAVAGLNGKAATVRIKPDLVREFDLTALAGAPIKGSGLMGWVLFLDTDLQSKDLLTLAKITGVRVANEIEHFRRRGQREVEAAARERDRIGRDIHDSLLQSLTAVGLRMKVLESRLPDAAREEMVPLRQEVTKVQQRLRYFVTDSRSRPLSRPGFVVLTDGRRIASMAANQWGCSLDYDVTPENLNVPSLLGTHLGFVMTEAIANAVKHGQASEVRITISRDEEQLHVKIKDNGIGFGETRSPDAGAHEVEMTPRSIEERVTQLSGKMKVDWSPKGVTLDIDLPLR